MSSFRDLLFNRKKHEKSDPVAYHNNAPASSSKSYINAVYYPNWKAYSRPPSSLNLNHITHIFYAFVWLKPDGTIHSSDEYADTEVEITGVRGALADLKRVKTQHPHIKTLLSVGGGGKGSDNFAIVAHNRQAVGHFVHSVKRFLEEHRMDGVDIDWEHPSDAAQGRAYIHLLSALRNSLPAPQYIITSALPCGEWALRHINLAQASQHLDYINLMCYDFSGPWTELCGHQAQLYSPKKPHSDTARISGDSAVNYIRRQGVPPSKILFGIPAYGRSFLGAKKPGSSYTGSAGEDGTFEYHELPRPGAKVVHDEECCATYCVGGDAGFVTYDDPQTVQAKARYVQQKGLGGLFYWTGPGDTNDERSLVATGWKTLHG